MQSDFRFILQNFHPEKAIGICPYRVVDPREVNIKFAASFFQEMWKEKTHFIMGKREFFGIQQIVPEFLSGRFQPETRIVFCPCIRKHSTGSSNTSCKNVE